MVQRYKIDVPESRLSIIRNKIAAYDWDQLPDIGGWKSGVGKADLKRLTDYWLDRFDWRVTEQHLNQLPHFVTDVEGERIHFVHARGDGSKAPLLLLHGWPGSFIEFEHLIAPLVADGHDVIVPSLPGFAFSNPITGIIGPRRAGDLMHILMTRLFGDVRYIVQGGDWGAHIASWMESGLRGCLPGTCRASRALPRIGLGASTLIVLLQFFVFAEAERGPSAVDAITVIDLGIAGILNDGFLGFFLGVLAWLALRSAGSSRLLRHQSILELAGCSMLRRSA